MTKKAEGELSCISQPLDLLPPTVRSALKRNTRKEHYYNLTKNFRNMNHIKHTCIIK